MWNIGIFKIFQYFQNSKLMYLEDNQGKIAEMVTKESPVCKAAR